MLNSPAPEKLTTADDWFKLGEYWFGYAQGHGEGWGSALHAFGVAATRYESVGDAARAEDARISMRSAQRQFDWAQEKQLADLRKKAQGGHHSPICNGVNCAPSCRPIR